MAAHSEVFLGTATVDTEREREREQITRALDGNVEAFRAIIERHHHGLFRLAVRMLGDETEAEDAVQETFARAYRRLDRFDFSHRLSTWLYRIALNICRDHLKSPRRREHPGGMYGSFDFAPFDERQGVDVRLDQKRLVARVRPSYREALVLKDIQELSYGEMREITGAPVTALKIRVLRARAKLRSLLEQEAS